MDISELVREMTKLVKASVPKTVTWPIILGLNVRAIGQQLGLSLKFRREPVEILVIDRAELVNGPSRTPLAVAFAEPRRNRFPRNEVRYPVFRPKPPLLTNGAKNGNLDF